MADRFGLSAVTVIGETQGASVEKVIAKAAAHYFISVVQPEDVIGVGWGKSVAAVVSQMVPLSLPKTRVVPLAGSFGTELDYLPNAGAVQLAQTIGGTPSLIHSPAFCHSVEEYRAILSNPQTSEVIEAGNHADIHMLGMGGIAGHGGHWQYHAH